MIAIDTAEPAGETGSELVVQGQAGSGNRNGNGIVVQAFDDNGSEPPELKGRNITVELSKFELVEKMTRMLAHSAFVPKHLVDKDDPLRTQANCFRIALQAHNWDRNVFDVADRSYVTNGKLGFEGKLIASVVNTRAGLKGRLAYKYTGDGENRTVEVSGTFRDESEPRTITLSFKQAKTNNEMWMKDPDQKLAYCGALRWARRHCPEVIDGVMSEEDLEVIGEQELPPPVDPAVEEAKRVAAEAAKLEASRKQGEALRAQLAEAEAKKAAAAAGLAGGKGVVEPPKVEPVVEAKVVAPVVVAPVEVQPTAPTATSPVSNTECRATEPISAYTKSAIVACCQALSLPMADYIRAIKSCSSIAKSKASELTEHEGRLLHDKLRADLWSKEPANAGPARETKAGELSLEVPVEQPPAVETPSSPQAGATAVATPKVDPAKQVATMSAAVLARLNRAVVATPNPLFTLDEQHRYMASKGVTKFNFLTETDALALAMELEAKVAAASAKPAK